MRALSAVGMLLAVSAMAQPAAELSPPPLPPVDETAPAPPPPPSEGPPVQLQAPPVVANAPLPQQEPVPTVTEPPYYERCFGVPSTVWVPGVRGVVVVNGGSGRVSSSGSGASGGSGTGATHGAQPVGESGSGSSSGGSGGSMDGRALVVLAVVALAVLPVVVYAFDSDAPAIARQRFFCPTFSFDGAGGALVAPNVAGSAFGGRLTATFGHVGVDGEFDLSGFFAQFSTHLLVRPTPKKHLEGGLALGYRRFSTATGPRDGFDVGLPHTYVFWRSDLRQFGLEIRPNLLIGGAGIDGGVEAALVVPLAQVLHLRLGGRVFTAGPDVLWGAQTGLRLTL